MFYIFLGNYHSKIIQSQFYLFFMKLELFKLNKNFNFHLTDKFQPFFFTLISIAKFCFSITNNKSTNDKINEFDTLFLE